MFALASSLNAATWYVATTGSDSNAGTAGAPFATIQKGVNVAAPGDTVSVADGTYGPNGHFTCGTACSANGFASPVYISKSGTASAPITITAQNKWGAILDCGLPYGYSGDGTDGVQACDAYFVFQGSASYVTIQNFAITGGYWNGVSINANNSHIGIIGNHIYNIGNRHYAISATNPDYGIVGVYAGTGSSYITWDGNEFNNIGRLPTAGNSLTDYDHDHGLYVYNGPYTITNNIFHDQDAGWGIQAAPGSHDAQILNNTFVAGTNPGRNGCMMLWGQHTNFTIENNIFYNGLTYAIETYQATEAGTLIVNNLVYGAPSGLIDSYSGSISQSGNLLNSNPLFVNAAGYDYHLQAGSPGIDAGAAVSVTSDFDGNPRPLGAAIDIGAYEYTGSATTPVTSTPSGSTGGTPVTTPVTSTPSGAVLGISPSSLNFGSIVLGTSSAVKLVTLTNPGSSSITLTNSTLANSAFAYGGTGTCNIGTVIQPGGSCTISVKFTPAASGAQTGTLTVTNTGAKTTEVVTLSGSGGSAAGLTLSTSSLNFGSVAAGSTSATQLVTLSNTGTTAVTLTNSTLGNSVFAYGGIGTCNIGSVIQVGGSCTISVKFAPTTSGAQTGTLTVVDTATTTPQVVTLSATGL